MCYLSLEEAMYSNVKAFWKALIINQKGFFTFEKVLNMKETPTKKDILIIQEVIKELGELQIIKRIGNRFYIVESAFIYT